MKIPIVATPGAINGNAILWNVYNSLAPSILADSMIDLLIVALINCLKKNTVPIEAIEGIISAE